ncbi:transcription repressor NadR [Fonticella tunisiensis]|uniref:Transcriptional regulator n=1 Tax=Fonticella tunisiensis TaxID=1096341 RepID=A0A4V3ERR3_9CLOT|nr:transcription repressor NadR [Fonticella tunisiensis]TDT45993.1 hypothetical protein EDD71_14213 [Fonticella tunisiensis]
MKGDDRRRSILNLLKGSRDPIKGSELSTKLNVTRQVIVQDIALLRAEGNDIIATPQGYILLQGALGGVKRVVAVKHSEHEVEDELKTIISLGGKVIDVTIEHKIYGEITGKLMLKSIYDLEQFIEKLNKNNSKPLLQLTGGVHLHTIEADGEEIMDSIISRLEEKGYLISQEV